MSSPGVQGRGAAVWLLNSEQRSPDPGRDSPGGGARVSSRRVLHSLALVRGPLQHGGHLQQGAVVPELGQHLEQQHDGAVHVPGEAARPVDLVHGDPPDALWDGGEGF